MVSKIVTAALLLGSAVECTGFVAPTAHQARARGILRADSCAKPVLCHAACSKAARVHSLCRMSSEVEYSAVATPQGNSNVRISVMVPGITTKKAYSDAIRDLSSKKKIPGFSTGSKVQRVPDSVIVNHYGEELVKGHALELLTETAIKRAIEDAGIKAIGQAELVQDAQSLVASLTPGEPLHIDVRVDIWPEVEFTAPYTGFTIEAEAPAFDQSRYDATMKRLQERAVVLTDAPEGYTAAIGDACVVDMTPYELLDDDTKGPELPKFAGGEDVEIVMEEEKFMPGLMEGLTGIGRGQTREVRVTFPAQLGGPAAVLSGKRAVFEVTCKNIKQRALPELNDAFADAIRPGLSFAELKEEVLSALAGEGDKKKFESRDKALEESLLSVVKVEIPETLVVERARQKFAIMMTDMKNQGQQDEDQLRNMITAENFNKYKEVVRAGVTKSLQLSLLLSAIAEKEGLTVNDLEVDDQMELIRAEAKGEAFDEAAARDRIEATLQKEVVLQWVAERSTINWIEAKPQPAAAAAP